VQQMSFSWSQLTAVCAVMIMAATATAMETSSSSSQFVQLDLHVKITAGLDKYIEGTLSPQINKLAPHNEVDFNKTIPHVTLYLTEYAVENVTSVVSTLNKLMPVLARKYAMCDFHMGQPYAEGSYFMWRSAVTSCLQGIADNVTLELAPFRNVDQEVPDWVYQLPEPERSTRIALVKEYGSPNVFRFFDPHVTLAWSDQDDLNQLLTLEYPPFQVTVSEIGLGVVSDHGTVLRNKDIAHWTFN